jgi:hypothetical protein
MLFWVVARLLKLSHVAFHQMFHVAIALLVAVVFPLDTLLLVGLDDLVSFVNVLAISFGGLGNTFKGVIEMQTPPGVLESREGNGRTGFGHSAFQNHTRNAVLFDFLLRERKRIKSKKTWRTISS